MTRPKKQILVRFETRPDHDAVILRWEKDRRWHEVRGRYDVEDDPVQKIIDGMTGPHVSVIMAGDGQHVVPKHEDFIHLRDELERW